MRDLLKIHSSIRKIAFTLLVLLTPFVTSAQTFPVKASSMVMPPYSVYYEDYFSMLDNSWQVNLVFKDFNEISRDVKIIMSLEGEGISIRTKADLPLNNPITLFPGVPHLLTGVDLRAYLGFDKIDLVGRTLRDFQVNSRLPEGQYDFCVKVLDYKTNEVLSHESCNIVWLQLNDEPTLISPMCASIVDPTLPLNIVFQWQQTGLLSPNSATSTEYQLSVFEVTDPTIDPIAALGTGQAIRVFQSGWSPLTSYLYNIASPGLTVGKRYTYTVQARDISGRDVFKNNGFSEPCWFSYGYGEGGTVALTSPEDKDGFRKDDFQYFSWDAPDNKMEVQGVEYEFTIKEKDEGQGKEDAMDKNDIWYEYLSMPVFHDRGDEHSISKTSKPMTKGGQYVWRVEAFSGEQKVAESEIYEVAGPPILEYFYVERTKVEVTKISNPDFDSIAGSGLVKITADGQMAKINFSGLKLMNIAGAHFLDKGVIESPLEEEMIVLLNPKDQHNDTTKLVISALQLSRDRGFLLKGVMEYEFPLITDSDKPHIIKTEPSWFMNIEYKITGNPKLDKDYSIDLLEPLNFTLNLEANTDFYVIQNKYEAFFNGRVLLPDNVTPALVNGRVEYPFIDQPHLFYMQQENGIDASMIKAVNRTNIVVDPIAYTIDFSDEVSPEKYANDNYWKGLYLDEYKVRFKPIFTPSNSINFTKEIIRTINTSKSHNEGWVNSQGAHIYSHVAYDEVEEGVLFNTFPAQIDTLLLSVHNSELKNSYVNGGIKIPIISEKDIFDYTVPLSLTGFTDGYLDEDLDGLSFIHNENGGANKMYIDINRAVFVDKSYIQMNIDLDWQEFGVKLNNVAGFSAWGNYDIGFYTPGGVTTLTEQVKGKASGYDITIDFIGAGREQSLYAIGTSANIVMGEDVAGKEGPPVMSAYSIVENTLLPESFTFIPGTEGTIFDMPAPGVAQINLEEGGSQDFNLTANDATDDGNVVPGAGGASDEEFGSYLEGNSEIDIATNYTLEENQDKPTEPQLDIPEIEASNITYQDVVDILTIIKPFLKEEQQVKIDNLLELLKQVEQSVLAEIYNKLKENGFSINKLLKNQVDELADKLSKPIETKLGEVTAKIEKTVEEAVDKTASKFTDLLENGIQKIADGVSQAISNEAAKNILESTVNGAKASVTAEFKRTLHASVKKNITDKVTVVIDSTISYRLTSFIQEEVRGLGYALIDRNASSIKGDEILGNGKDMLVEMGEELVGEFQKVSIKGIKTTIETTAQEAYDGFDLSRVKTQILDSLEGAVSEEVLRVVGESVDKLLGENSLVGGVAEGVLANVEFNFDNIGEKVKNGDLDQIVSFDPTHIIIKSKIANIEGLLKFTEDDPIWGDSWQAMLRAEIHKPKIDASARFLNGKVDGYNYWFLELNIESGLNVAMGPATLDGIGGKVFHHMIYNPEDFSYKPYEQTKFGAGLNLYLFDPSGVNFHLNAVAELTVLEDYFTMEIRSYVGVKPNESDVAKIRPKMGMPYNDKWMATGSGIIAYNSRDKHLLGQFKVETHTKAICAGGEMGFDFQPGSWNIYVGKKADPLYAYLLCKDGMGINSWFDLGNLGFQLGLEANVQFKAVTPFWIKIPSRKFKPYASFGFYFLTEIDLAFKPKLKLNEAIIHLEAHAEIGAIWESTVSDKNGTWVLAGAYLKGLAHYKNTEEESFIKGELAGKVTVCNISVGIDLEVDKNI